MSTDEVIMAAWGLIANAGEGNWERETPEWQEAALRWRDEMFHPWLDEGRPKEEGEDAHID